MYIDMDNENKENSEILSILEYIKSKNLQGKTALDESSFSWTLGDIRMRFLFDPLETTILYYGKNRFIDGHFHLDNNEVIDLIEKLNSDEYVVEVSFSLFSSTFSVMKSTEKRKKSNIFVLRYYSKPQASNVVYVKSGKDLKSNLDRKRREK